MSSHSLYELEYVFHGETFRSIGLLFNDAVARAAQALKEGSWPVTIRPIDRRSIEET